MILVDFSSIIHRMIHTSVSHSKPAKVNGKYVTSDFIGLTKYYILQELFGIKQEFGPNFGDVIICLDKSAGGYWRKDFYPDYKAQRKKGREESDIDFGEVFKEVDLLTEQLKLNLPWKVIEVPKAEADDIMLILAKEYCEFEKVLIHSPDKDMIQAQRETENVYQYSALTKKWLVPENKYDNMEHWIMEHVCLGDASDNVPKVVDHTEFSKSFLDYIKAEGYNISSPMEFKTANIPNDEKARLITEFDVYKLNRKKESTGIKDIYKDMRFGASNLKKKIAEFGSLDSWLDSHPLYRKNYDRNFTLVMTEGIPSDIWNKIIVSFKEASTDYNNSEFEEYLSKNELKSILMELPNHFKLNRELTADDFGW
jgi:5'-3' exonuclease